MNVRVGVAIWTVALLAAVAAFALAASTDHPDDLTVRAVLGAIVGLVFVASGLIARYRRPDNRTGTVMVAAGFLWFLPALTQADDPVLFALGTALNDTPWAGVAFLILAYPTGGLRSLADRSIVAGTVGVSFVLRPLWTLVSDLRDAHANGPENAFLLTHRPALAHALETTIQVAALVLIVSAVAVLVQRWRHASAPARRELAPAFLSFAVTVLTLAAAVLLDVGDVTPAADVVYWIAMGALLTVPASFAIGLVRTRLARAGVGDLLVELGDLRRPDELRAALARALGDPTLEIAYWIPEQEGFVDAYGNPIPPPSSAGPRYATTVERGGRPIAALIHKASLREDQALLRSVVAAAGLALENERRLAEIAQSEARLRALVDALPDLMFRVDRDGRYLDVQGPDADLVAPARELVGKRIAEVLPPEPAEKLMRCVERLRPGSRVETVEYMLRLGPLNRHFEARVAPIGPDEVVLIVRDISDRKRSEAQLQRLQDELRARFEDLRRERDFIRAVVQAAPSYFCLIDRAGRIVRLNRSLERASSHDDESVREKRFWEVFVPVEERDEVRERVQEAVAELAPSEEWENRWSAADGREFVVAWSV
ncbi:MAG: PAS domain S-box protein, partial [Thermoleophilia bacterium]|nr:PAS domain S-box protein [Thermoleophilia bacterium]